jgi:glycosyltransferase involved in cell wall biosynthesis
MARFLFYDDKLINLMLQDEKPCGGSAVQTYGWIRGLMEEGQEVYVMTDSHGDNLLKAECRNIKLVPMYERKKGIRWLRWLYYRLPYTYKKISSVKPDYLYLSIPGWTSALFAVICRLLQIKLIQRISNDNQVDKRIRKQYSAIHQFFLNIGLGLSHHILCQNNFQLKTVKEKFPGKQVIKITNPFCLINEDVNEGSSSRRYIAWLGIYRAQKNLKLLFQIASILKHDHFVVAGKEGVNCDEDSRYYLEKLKQLPNVTFSGFLERKDILPFLSKARFLLNTSHYEGFSNTFLESWSVGTPVISSVQVNPDSIISKYDLGIVFKDVFDLCNQYAALSPELYQLMSDRAKKYVMHHHGYRVLSRKLLGYLSAADKKIPAGDSNLLPLTDQTRQRYFQQYDTE